MSSPASSSCWDVDLGTGEEGKNEEDNVEVDDGKEVSQVPTIAPPPHIPTAEPILVSSSDSEAADDLEFLKVQPTARDIVEHSFNQGASLSFSSSEEEEVMAPKARALGNKQAIGDELVK